MYRTFTAIIILCFSNVACAGDFAAGFAQGFLNTSNATLERRRCEQNYSPSMCNQMEADRRQKAEQEQLSSRVDKLEQENRWNDRFYEKKRRDGL